MIAQDGSRRIEPDAIYTVAQAAQLLVISAKRLRVKLQLGQVRGSRKLGTWRIRGAELLRVAS